MSEVNEMNEVFFWVFQRSDGDPAVHPVRVLWSIHTWGMLSEDDQVYLIIHGIHVI